MDGRTYFAHGHFSEKISQPTPARKGTLIWFLPGFQGARPCVPGRRL